MSELNKKFLDRVCNTIHTNVVNKLPNWLSFDWNSFNEEQLNNLEVTDLSPYGDYDTFKWNGDTYYIYRIDY